MESSLTQSESHMFWTVRFISGWKKHSGLDHSGIPFSYFIILVIPHWLKKKKSCNISSIGAKKRVDQEIFFLQTSFTATLFAEGVGHTTVLWATWTAKLPFSKATWYRDPTQGTHRRRSSFPRHLLYYSLPFWFCWLQCESPCPLLNCYLRLQKVTPNGKILRSRLKSEGVNK